MTNKTAKFIDIMRFMLTKSIVMRIMIQERFSDHSYPKGGMDSKWNDC